MLEGVVFASRTEEAGVRRWSRTTRSVDGLMDGWVESRRYHAKKDIEGWIGEKRDGMAKGEPLWA
jgi:hypothetical protein